MRVSFLVAQYISQYAFTLNINIIELCLSLSTVLEGVHWRFGLAIAVVALGLELVMVLEARIRIRMLI